MNDSPVGRYLTLGLELGRHAEGIVDAYFGPPELAEAVAAVLPVEPRLLVSAAEALCDELEDGWLRDQVIAVRTCAAALAGESMTYADEVEGCYGVRPQHTDEAVFAAAHAQLDSLLPGDGTLADRYRRWERSSLVPAERVEQLLASVIEEARDWTDRLLGLPHGEHVALEIVRDKPWWASCDYLGDLSSRIALNVDLPLSAFELLVLAVHEAYPGHHTERCCKEHSLVRGRGLLEETLVLSPTPQILVAEAIGALAPYIVLESEVGARLAAVLHGAGLELDLDHALAVRRAHEPCRWAEVNAALMLHEEGAGAPEALAYLQRWSLEAPEWASHLLRFMSEPTQRTYILTYSAGAGLGRAFVGNDLQRFRRLLTEQVRVRDLIRAEETAQP